SGKGIEIMKLLFWAAMSGLAITACGEINEGSTEVRTGGLPNVWIPSVSDEQGVGLCPTDNNIGATRASCAGSYCDNMSIFCGTLPPGFTSTSIVAWPSGQTSEEYAPVM